MKPITADSRLGIVLLALRAGPMTPDQFGERWPTGHNLAEAVRLDLVEKVGDEYRLTEAGRAAVPLRNPLAAKAAPAIHSPEVSTMPRGETRVTRDQVLDAIKEAGAAGINRKQLIERFGCSESNMDNHIMNLARLNAIFKPRPGHCVASYLEYAPAAQPEAGPAVPADDFAFDLTPVESDEIEAEEIEVTAVGDRRGPVIISDADDLDIGMFSSGRLEISIGRDTIVIEPGAMKKLRGFLGLFQEAA